MKIRNLLFLLLLAFSGCDHEEAVDPEIVTNDAQQLGQTSAVIEATIKDPGSVRPIQYGFIWDTIPGSNVYSAKHKIDLGSTTDAKTFSIKLDGLTPNTTYYYKGYTASVNYTKIFYGNEAVFKTLP